MQTHFILTVPHFAEEHIIIQMCKFRCNFTQGFVSCCLFNLFLHIVLFLLIKTFFIIEGKITKNINDCYYQNQRKNYHFYRNARSVYFIMINKHATWISLINKKATNLYGLWLFLLYKY